MQDRFVGDVGDFGKYGLLRWLGGSSSGGQLLRLGVVWYWNPDSEPQVVHLGGPHPCQLAFRYICFPNGPELALGRCDEELSEFLREIVIDRERSVSDIEASRILLDDTVYFREPVNGSGARTEWFGRAMVAVKDCDVVFLDPDNGLVDDNGDPDGVLPKYASYQEAAELWEQGKSLVIYQSFGRQGANLEIQDHAANLRQVLGIDGPPGKIIALRFRRTLARVFFVIPNPANPEVAQLLTDRVQAFMDSAWGRGGHFTRVDC